MPIALMANPTVRCCDWVDCVCRNNESVQKRERERGKKIKTSNDFFEKSSLYLRIHNFWTSKNKNKNANLKQKKRENGVLIRLVADVDGCGGRQEHVAP